MTKFLETLVARTLLPFVQVLPLNWAQSLGASIGWFSGNVLKIRRAVVEKNISRVFPDMDFSRRRELAERSYQFFGRAAVDWLRYDDVVDRETISLSGRHHLDDLESDGGIIASAHIGYWEYAAIKVAEKFGKFTVYADRLSNPQTDQIIQDLRSQRSVESVHGPGGLRELCRRAKSGEVVGIIADQRPRNQFEYVRFFDDRVKNTRILSFLARNTRKPVVPVAMVRTDSESLKFKIYPPLESSLETVNEDNRKVLLREYNAWLEERIQTYPEQYFWAHRRWKGSK